MIINCEATPLVGKADAFALDSKLADYIVNSVGQLAWMQIEFVEGGFRLLGASANDRLNSQYNRMKSIALERPFLLTFCCCRQKVSRAASGRRAGCCVKKAMRPPRMAEGRTTQEQLSRCRARSA